ncbi:MAG TPA: Wzz/FepE/Etk N-terminal domain-containing protein [Bacteroidia bacterium]|nr:Wzz/FepE/Etk N-terminal domain-containing protein [Bacteroidia bacterium]
MPETKTDYQFNTIEIIRLVLRRKWPIIIITVLAAIASIIFSGPAFITPKYLSTVIFYPTANNSVSGGILEDATARDVDASEFGEEENAEQALQILHSSELTGRVTSRFNLMQHYKIDPNGSMPYTKLANKIKSNIKFRRTEYLSIEISVLDEDPKMAAAIANGISEIYDSARTDIQRQVASEAYAIIEEEYKNKVKEVEDLQAKLNAATNGKNVDPSALSGGKNQGTGDMIERQRQIQKSGTDVGTLIQLSESMRLQVEQMNHLKEKFRKAKADMEKYIPHKFLISPAFAAEQKAYPRRSIIVLLATFGAFFLSVLMMILINRFQYFRTRLDENPSV